MAAREFRRQAALFGALALALWICGAARAASQFDVSAGYDGLAPEHSWFPITCELRNDGPSFNAVIEVTPKDMGAGLTRRIPVDLPANTRKQVLIPEYEAAGTWSVRLLDEGGKVRAEQTAQAGTARNGLPLVASLARTAGGAPVFPDLAMLAAGEPRYASARLQPALFPDNPLALEGIDLLYLSSERAAKLSIGQANALLAWLQQGGHLVFGVEQLTDVNATPWVRELLPCELNAMLSLNGYAALRDWTGVPSPTNAVTRRKISAPPVSDPEQAAFTAAALEVAMGTLRDGKVLVGGDDAPLAIEASRGRGTITVLTFSPEREPFVSWKGRPWFWAKLAGIPAAAFQKGAALPIPGRLSSDGIFGAMIDTKQVRKLPLGWLLALLLAYLAVIGPLDQYWLKKINRPMLTWITFPCYVLIFSALIYFIGFKLRAGQLEWNEFNIVDILPSNDRAVLRGQTYISIYSPNNARYNVAGREKFASLRGESLGLVNRPQESSGAAVTQTGDNFKASVFVPVWTSQLFVGDWFQAAPLPLEMSVSRQGNGWQVTAENHLDRSLPVVRAVLGGEIYELGPLGRGETKTVSLEKGHGASLEAMATHYGPVFREATQARHNSFGENASPLADLAEAGIAASFLASDTVNTTNNSGWNKFGEPASLDLTRFADGRHGILLAWDPDHALTEGLNKFQPKRLQRNSLLRLVVPIE